MPRVSTFLNRFLRSGSARDREPVPVVLYTRSRCCLCDLLKQELARAQVARPYRLSEVDIDTDPRLAERFGRSIPVLEIGGRVAFKGRMTAEEFQRKFARLAAEWERTDRGTG